MSKYFLINSTVIWLYLQINRKIEYTILFRIDLTRVLSFNLLLKEQTLNRRRTMINLLANLLDARSSSYPRFPGFAVVTGMCWRQVPRCSVRTRGLMCCMCPVSVVIYLFLDYLHCFIYLCSPRWKNQRPPALTLTDDYDIFCSAFIIIWTVNALFKLEAFLTN